MFFLPEQCFFNVFFHTQGESQYFCHCVHATNYKFMFIKTTALTSR